MLDSAPYLPSEIRTQALLPARRPGMAGGLRMVVRSGPVSWQPPVSPRMRRRPRLRPMLCCSLILVAAFLLATVVQSHSGSQHTTANSSLETGTDRLNRDHVQPAHKAKPQTDAGTSSREGSPAGGLGFAAGAAAGQEEVGGNDAVSLSGLASSGPRRVLEKAKSAGSDLEEGGFGKGQLGSDGLKGQTTKIMYASPPPPYGPRGINDNDPPEGNVFLDDEPDDEDYRETSKKWSKPTKLPATASLIGPTSGHCYSYYDAGRVEGLGVANAPKVDVKFEGEFGYELMVVLPFAYFHFLNGSLGATTSCGDASTAMFYWFNPRHRHDGRCVRDDFKNLLKPYGWRRGLHKSPIPREWSPPPFAAHFREWGKVWRDVPAGEPLVVIANKISNEWFKGPINFLDLATLRRVIRRFVEAGFYVVYNRAGSALPEDQWQAAGLGAVKFDDYKVIRKMYTQAPFQGRVKLLQDIHRDNPGISYNEAQVRMMSRSQCFVSVQGGNSILSSYFGGTNIIYARKGFEIDYRAYTRAYYRLSGTSVMVARSYYRLDKHVEFMIRRNRCGAI